MSLLQVIIDAATDDSVSTGNLLRKVQVAAHRLQAGEITEWVRKKLYGYPKCGQNVGKLVQIATATRKK